MNCWAILDCPYGTKTIVILSSESIAVIRTPPPPGLPLVMTNPSLPPDVASGFPSSTSPSLLARVKASDQEAWRRLVHLYGPLIYGWCRRWQLAAEDVADVFQEVFQAVAV